METVKVASYDFERPPYIIYFDDLSEFMKVAKQNNYVIFETEEKRGILRKKHFRILFFVVSEFLICIYMEEKK